VRFMPNSETCPDCGTALRAEITPIGAVPVEVDGGRNHLQHSPRCVEILKRQRDEARAGSGCKATSTGEVVSCAGDDLALRLKSL
jgi:hypothetical protein